MISSDILEIATVVQQGGVIAYPTEAVFGLGCDPNNETAVRRLLKIKQRAIEKGLIVIAADYQQVSSYLLPLQNEIKKRIFATWPGAVTWVLPTKTTTSKWLTGSHNSLAVRVTAHKPVRQLCHTLGHGLVSTSANLSGEPPAKNTQTVIHTLGKYVDGILDCPVGNLTQPTQIRNAITNEIYR